MRTRATWLLVALLLATAVTALAAGCGGDDDSDDSTAKTKASDFAGAVAAPAKPAPPLKLEDSTGRTFDIAEHRGQVVLVTWLYANCPDVCPLIVSNFKVTQAKLGDRAKDVKFVAVSVDPKGDTSKRVNAFLKKRGMNGRMQYLLGSRSTLGIVWKSWGIVAEPDASNPELIEHASPIYGVSASGRITTLYPANFKPEQILHDVPLLARQ
ncbi:MAG TPA: SCO family protein [Thermoleophilaceae bacterium]